MSGKEEWCKGSVLFQRLGCQNVAKKDGYCGIHHPDAVKARQERGDKRWNEKILNAKRTEESRKRTYARSFVETATLEELLEHKKLVDARVEAFRIAKRTIEF